MRLVSSLLVALAVVWALALTAREARAQTPPSVTGILGAVTRCEHGSDPCVSADNKGAHPHPNGVLVNVLNFEDCSADLAYEFQLGVAYPDSSYRLEAWVGTQDCSPLNARQTPATSVCWPAADFTVTTINPTLLRVRMQDIVSGAFTTTHPTQFVASTDPAVCQGQAQTGATTITLYIFFVDGGSNPVGTVQQYPITLDMRAGNVQGNISAGIGDTLLIVSVPSTTDRDTTGWNVYCDPPPGQENALGTVPVDAASSNGTCPAPVPDSSSETGASDALAATDSAADSAAADSATPPVLDDAGGNACGAQLNGSGIPSPGGCSSSSVLVSGGTSVLEGGTTAISSEAGVSGYGAMNLAFQYGQATGAKYLCGQTGATSHAINVEGLKDGYYYNVAVAAVDAHGNVGPLSNVACGEPLPVDDFWTAYYKAGGHAGGSNFCSTEGVGVPAGTGGLGVVMVASIVAMVRRRRRS